MKLKKISGTALIEFAIVLPVLLVILIGTIEFAIILYNKAVVTNASREGARYGIILRTPTYADEAAIVAVTEAYTQNKLISFGGDVATVSVSFSSPMPAFGEALTVTVNYTYTDLILHNFINFGQQHNIQASTTMTYE